MPVPAPTPAPLPETLRALGDRVRPLAAAAERTLAVPTAIAALIPAGGLQRGITVATGGVAASSLALALAGPVTASGAWVAVVGVGELGLLAAVELGVDLERVLLVADPEPTAWPSVVAALLDAFDLVLTRPPGRVGPSVQRRLNARTRDRGSVLVQVGGDLQAWTQRPDVVLTATAQAWVGVGVGHGRLVARQVVVEAAGRRAGGRSRHGVIWLPSPVGGLSTVNSAELAGPLKRFLPGRAAPAYPQAALLTEVG